jgi:hypothetical protein
MKPPPPLDQWLTGGGLSASLCPEFIVSVSMFFNALILDKTERYENDYFSTSRVFVNPS